MFKMYAIFDVKSASYTPPFTFPTDGVAVRNFEDSVNAPGSHIGAHPGDFSLVALGTFDADTGRISALDKPELVVTAAACIKVRQPMAVNELVEKALAGKEVA